MIPAIIFYLIKKFRAARKKKINKPHQAVPLSLLLIIASVAVSSTTSAQQHSQRYSILYKGDKVGYMQLLQTTNGDSVRYKIVSDVKMRMIFKIHVATTEESLFVKDRLISSAVVRNVNGSSKLNRQMFSNNNKYMLYNDGKKKNESAEAIVYNFGRLYNNEPIGRTKVWSDAFHEYLALKEVGAHKYKVTLPDGDYNYYYYQNGICNKVEIVHSFYTIQMVLN